MSLARFRADRLLSVAALQTLAYVLGTLLFREGDWSRSTLLLLTAVLLLMLRYSSLPRTGRLFGVLAAGGVFLFQARMLWLHDLTVAAAMTGAVGLGLLAVPLLTVDRSAPEHAKAYELTGPVFGLVLLGSAVTLFYRHEDLPVLATWEGPLLVIGLLGGALHLLDPFSRLHLPAVRRGLGLSFTLPLAAASIAQGSFATSLLWLVWAVTVLLGDLREMAEWRQATDQLLRQRGELQALNAALSQSEERFRIAFAHAPIGMAVLNMDGQICQVNPSLCEMLGYAESELTGLGIGDITHPEDLDDSMELFQQALAGQIDRYHLEKRYLHEDGRVIWGHMSASVVRDGEGEWLYMLAQVQDVTERKRFEEQLKELADRDGLTGLYNRRRLQEELQWAIALWQRYGTTGAVLMMDLDGFKAVNDTLGHHMGDELLRRVAATLKREMRASDLYGRMGGDEFACFLAAVTPEEAEQVAGRILRAVEQTTLSDDFRHVYVTGSVGIAMLPEHGTTMPELLIRADKAMYRAKGLGKNRACLYGPEAEALFPTAPPGPAEQPPH